MTNWTEFQGRQSAADIEEPAVTIQKHGTLGINLAAYLALGSPKYIRYVKAADGSGKFGIIRAEKKEPNTYGLRKQSSGRSFVVSATLFLRWAGVDFEEARTLPLQMEGDVGVVDPR